MRCAVLVPPGFRAGGDDAVTRWWTNREVAQLVRLAADGMVASQIAGVLGRTPRSVFARARRDGVTLAMTRAAPRTIALSNLPVGGVSGGML